MDNETYILSCSSYLESTRKRCFDISLSLILLVPVILILMFVLPVVFVIDGGHVLFFQQRIGKNGKRFLMPKIRTLKNDADPDRPSCSYDIDSFTTRTGKFLRRHRIDELPQIFSVLVGKMSLVGPRPELPDVVGNYSSIERQRLCAKPGITGIWQIKATRNQPIHQNIQYDFYYLKNASLWLDLRILCETVPFVLKAKNKISYEKNRLYTYNISLSK